MPEFLAIDADCGLYVRRNGHGNDQRFAQMFANVWRSIPLHHRAAMVAHWEQWAPKDEGRLCLSIAMENLSTLRGSVGDCAAMGTELKFYARVMDMLPDDQAAYVIAHELAHVLQVSQGKTLRPNPHPLGDAVAYANSPIEREPDEMAARWGFDGSRLNSWLEANVDWSAFPPDPY
jgi:hypothetical protein